MGKSAGKNEPAPPTQTRIWRYAAVVALCCVAILVGWWFAHDGPTANPTTTKVPTPTKPALPDEREIFSQYAGSDSCQKCHEEAFKLWKSSNHGLAERLIIPALDESAFSPGRVLKHGAQETELSWTNSKPVATSTGLSAKPETLPIARVIGNDPLRQFLVPFPGGRFQTLEASFDWFNVFGHEDRKPGEWGHWTGRGMNWNYMCANCHNTRLQRNYDEPSDSYRTTMAEMSVGCEACHGSLKAHNQWQLTNGKSGIKDPTLHKLTPAQTLDNCGSCHARRTDLTADFAPGDSFNDRYDLTILDHTDTYYADGQVRDEDYEYGSFLSSRMASRGVLCVDCHNPHSAKTLLAGNLLCMRCHSGGYSNAPLIDPPSHTHHVAVNTSALKTNRSLVTSAPTNYPGDGTLCVDCHMPQTVYMQRHWRHDHGFTIPDPLLTKEFGIPNACNRCHQDKTADWALNQCQEWYRSKMERPTRKRAELFARAKNNAPESRTPLLAAAKSEESPYWRAVTFGLLEPWSTRPEVTAALLHGLDDTNALVRASAARSLEAANANPSVHERLQKALDDSVRSVRVAAASSLRATLAPESAAGRDFEHYLTVNADEPAGQLQRGIYLFSRNDLTNALVHFQKAVSWDPYSAAIRRELAVALSALNRPQEALDTLKEACRLAPRDAESHYKLALAYNEVNDLQNTIPELTLVTQLDPGHARAWYNLGLARNSLGQTDAALEALSRAESGEPEDPRIPYARGTILARQQRPKEARIALHRALEIDPSFSDATQLLQLLTE